ncbi:penicillin-binding protein 1C [Chromatiaceae bacterium AAb-1]|nr:penicillin-binding protein 1C [Chromatiaceae bacterium AAb-1]
MTEPAAQRRRWKGRLWLSLPLLIAAGLLLLVLSPVPDLYQNYPQASAFFDRHRQLLSLRLAADERYRLKVPLADIAPALQQATLLYEDQHFYRHFGVDLAALGRAFWQSFVVSGRRQGASTITMQLARLRFSLDTTTVSGKLKQIAFAYWLEWHYSKEELLQAYFNYAPYGGNIEGAAAASLIYFGKEASELTVAEALALAVIPQNPVQRNPQSERGMMQMEQARQRLLGLWQRAKPELTAAQLQRLQLPVQVTGSRQLPFAAPHFIHYLTAANPQLQGRFYTSLDLSLQQAAERRIQDYLLRQQHKGLNNASALLINRHTMQINAWVGSADFFNTAISGQVDGVTARRSPGSALKPFVYALALQQGLIHPQTLLKDLPRRFGTFNPENFDQQFYGPLSATRALILSRNLPAVQLQSRLQQPDFYQWLQQAGVSLPQAADYYGLALVLGGMELTMQQLVQLYAMLGNKGQWQPLQWRANNIEKGIEKNTEANTAENTENSAGRPLLTPEAAFLTLDMLRQHPGQHNGLVQQLQPLSAQAQVAWKTGTSYAYRDAWAVGLSGDYVLAVWLGNFDGSSNPNLVGLTAAGPLFFNLLGIVGPQQAENQQLFTPGAALNLRKVAMCSRSGELPNKACPHTQPGWFIPGVSPITVSTVHRQIPVFVQSGNRACVHQPPHTRLEVFEFWPSDIMSLYRSAGIQLRQAPPFEQSNQQSLCPVVPLVQKQPPQIRAPEQGLIYQLDIGKGQQLALQASFDGDVSQAYWFADNSFIGSVKPGETLFWQAESGQYLLRVVDDAGSAATVRITVQSRGG